MMTTPNAWYKTGLVPGWVALCCCLFTPCTCGGLAQLS